tara:strand:- start:324 stop:1268 length:945 start_codon:yes stop_codon:yes gene_type:complete
MKILVTGAAGFIGYHLSQLLADLGEEVVGFDNFNNYYQTSLKYDRKHYLNRSGVNVKTLDLISADLLTEFISQEAPDLVVHLAGYAGVRDSINNPFNYINNNIVGTQNLIEACKKADVQRVLYASTSCVMVGNPLPWKESDKLNHQLNPYGYSKACNESQFMCSQIPTTIGMRFFTVYGPWGRPDMALFNFTKRIIEGNGIDIYNYGQMSRDFTYVDDIVQGILLLLDHRKGEAFHEIYNIGHGNPVSLMEYVKSIEEHLGIEAHKTFLPKHPADAEKTWADVSKIKSLGWEPKVSVHEGVGEFVDWYKSYYGY